MSGSPDQLVYTPQDAAELSIDMLNKLKLKQGLVSTGVSDIDSKMLPLRPGELVTVIGYTSHFKSGFMDWIAGYNSKLIDQDAGDVIVKVTWEQSVEEDTLRWLAQDASISVTSMARGDVGEADWKLLMQSYARRVITPLWVVGHSNKQSEAGHRARPRLTMSDVTAACEYISHGATDQDRKIRLIVLDYLQRIRPDPHDGTERRIQMVEAVNRAKDLAICFGCPVLLGVQAGRGVNERENKLPRLDDGQETSNIEQSSDKVISVWYPVKTEEEGTIVEGYPVSAHLLIVGVLKQKLAPTPAIIPVFIDPEKSHIANMSRKSEPDYGAGLPYKD